MDQGSCDILLSPKIFSVRNEKIQRSVVAIYTWKYVRTFERSLASGSSANVELSHACLLDYKQPEKMDEETNSNCASKE